MKKIFLSLFAFLFFLGCYTNKWNFKKNAVEAREPKYECFVELNDGTIKKYESIKYKVPPMSYGYLSADGSKLEYKPSEVRAFQTADGYYLRYIHSLSLKFNPSFMPDFKDYIVRVINGKIELFRAYKTSGNSVSSDSYSSHQSFLIRKGDKGPVPVDKRNLKEFIKDNKSVLNNFDDTFGKGRIDDIIEVINEYN